MRETESPASSGQGSHTAGPWDPRPRPEPPELLLVSSSATNSRPPSTPLPRPTRQSSSTCPPSDSDHVNQESLPRSADEPTGTTRPCAGIGTARAGLLG